MTRWVPLSELMQPVQDRSVKVSAAESYSIAGVYGFGRGVRLRERIAGTDTTYASLTRLVEGDVVYSKLKAFEGAVAVVDKQAEGRFVSPEFPVFTPSDSIQPGYLKHFLGSDLCQQQLAAMSSGIGARRERVSPTRFLSLKIPMPSLEDQARIAAHLDIIERLHEQQTSTGSAEELWRSLLAQPPAGTTTKVTDLLIETARPVVTEPDIVYPMLGVRWYGGGAFVRDQRTGAEIAAKTVYQVLPGDLIYNRLFAWKKSFALVGEGAEGFVSNEFPAFNVRAGIIKPEVLHYLLLTDAFTRAVDGVSTGSTPTSRNRLKVGHFLELEVDVPGDGAQRQLSFVLATLAKARRMDRRKRALAVALLPAARNEIFSSMR